MRRTPFRGLVRAGILASVIACLLSIAGCRRNSTAGEHTAAHPDGPNVLLVTLDTTRADHLSCYGYGQRTSANLDRLAAEGALFANAIAQAAVTPVSHASILTGLNPYTHGLRVMHGTDENRLRDSCVTLAEVYHGAGYRTAAFVSAFPVTERFGFDQGFDVFDADFLVQDASTIVSGDGVVNTGRNQRRADETTDRALAWLAAVEEPFCVWLHYFDPHDPQLRPPDEFMREHPLRPGPMKDMLRALYDVEIRFMDQQLGRVFETLRESGRLDRTVVVVTADHGEGLGDHDWWTHGILYQEQIHVPLIIRAPGVRAGTRVDWLVRTIDIMPTVLELAGLGRERFPATDGASLVPLLSEGAADPGYAAYADSINMLTYQFSAGISDEKNDMLFAEMDGTWKYIHHALRPGESELYNLREDPRELTNLFTSRPEQVPRLLAGLRTRRCLPEQPPGADGMSPRDRARLRTLGYITDTRPTIPDDD
jgi:arylsulfatase A-like enzyme